MSEEQNFDPANTMPGAPTGALPSFARNLPAGAQQFIRSYTPADDDVGVIASFEMVEEFQTFLSEKEGKEIYKQVPYIRINVRGNDKMEVHRPVLTEDKRRFPNLWAAFEKGQQVERPGSALSLLNIPPQTIRHFHAKNVFTVEDLALVEDNNLSNLGAGGREWRHKARSFVQARAPKVANADEVQELRAELAEAVRLMKAQQEKIETLEAKRGPGRPPKDHSGA